MRILLTGASGFMGQRWLELHGTEHEVFTLGRGDNVLANTKAHIKCDLSKSGDIARAREAGNFPEKIDAVVHLAVSRLHRTFPQTALDLYEVNVASTAHLLDYAREAGAKQFVLGSSGSVYNGVAEGELKESRDLTPQLYFPASKLAPEILANQYREYFNIATIRFFTPYGPGQTQRLIPDLVSRVREGRAVTLPATGGGITLSALYLDDCVMVVNKALTQGWNTTTNAASPEIMNIEEIANTIAKVLGTKAIIERNSSAPGYALAPDLAHFGTLVDLSKLVNFEAGLSRIIAFDAAAAK